MVAVKKEGWLPSFNPKSAFTLLEWMMVMAINLILLWLVLPYFGWMVRQSQTHRWCAQVSALIQQASQMSDFAKKRFDLHINDREFVLYDEDFVLERLELPEGWEVRPLIGLPHPTQSKNITFGLTSTHSPYIRFFDMAASSATLTLSSPPDQAICAVVSSATGRARVFIWDHQQSEWLDYF